VDKSKLFKEFLVCPKCGNPLVQKEEVIKKFDKESKYCTQCGKEIASTYAQALAIANETN
jgi:uncharacterized protein with PIN domain